MQKATERNSSIQYNIEASHLKACDLIGVCGGAFSVFRGKNRSVDKNHKKGIANQNKGEFNYPARKGDGGIDKKPIDVEASSRPGGPSNYVAQENVQSLEPTTPAAITNLNQGDYYTFE